MNRRDVIRVLGATGAALTVAATVGSAADDKQGDADVFAACGKACRDCLADCEGCYKHCVDLLAGGQKDHAATAAVCLDCAELCAATAKLVGRRGPLAAAAAEACAKACDDCGKACGKSAAHAVMQECAEACTACAKACRALVEKVAKK